MPKLEYPRIRGFSLTSSGLVARYRQRRREILDALPPDARKQLKEYIQLGKCIRRIYAEETRYNTVVTLPHSAQVVPPARVPMSVHKEKLVEFLTQHGPSTRNQILSGTGIPAGSLSELLTKECEQKKEGFWTLKSPAKK
jgi:hypothetical protein